MAVVCNPIRMGRWSELMVVCVCQSDEVMREADANETSGELGLAFPGSLVGKSLFRTAPKSTVTLFTPEKHQFQTHPNITLEDTQLPLECSPKILGVIMDTSLSFHKHCNYVSERIDKRNNMLKALAGSSWGQ